MYIPYIVSIHIYIYIHIHMYILYSYNILSYIDYILYIALYCLHW